MRVGKLSPRYAQLIDAIIADRNAGMKLKDIKAKYNIKADEYYSWTKRYDKLNKAQNDEFSTAVHDVMNKQHEERSERKRLESECKFLIESLKTVTDVNNTLHAVKNSKEHELIKSLIEQRIVLLGSLKRLNNANAEMLDYILGQL